MPEIRRAGHELVEEYLVSAGTLGVRPQEHARSLGQIYGFLHNRGILHADVGNRHVRYCENGVARIFDFGEAVVWDSELDDDSVRQLITMSFDAFSTFGYDRIVAKKSEYLAQGFEHFAQNECQRVDETLGAVARATSTQFNIDEKEFREKLIGWFRSSYRQKREESYFAD